FSARSGNQGTGVTPACHHMDSWEFNKTAGAVLGTALVVFGLGELRSAIYHSPIPQKPGFAIQVTETAAGGGQAGGGAETAKVPLATLLAKARRDQGPDSATAGPGRHQLSPRDTTHTHNAITELPT